MALRQRLQDTRQCRFCLDTGEGEGNPLIDPCRCRGSVRWVHLECLRRWIALDPAQNGRVCGLCRTPFQILFVPALERFPEVATVQFLVLRYAGILSVFLQYLVFMCYLNGVFYSPEPVWSSMLLVQTIIHCLYGWAFAGTWNVQNVDLYTAMARRSRVPLMLVAHGYCLYSFLVWHDVVSSLAIDFLFQSYWGAHMRILQRVNQRILAQN